MRILTIAAAVLVASTTACAFQPQDESPVASESSALVCGLANADAVGTYTWAGVRGSYNVTAKLVLSGSAPTCFGCMPLAPTFDLTETLNPTCLAAGCKMASQFRHTAGNWYITSNGRAEGIQLSPDTTLADYSSLNPTYLDENKCKPLSLITKEDDGTGTGTQITEIWKRSK